MEWIREGFTVTTDRARLDRDVIARFLASSYWAERIPRATVDKSIESSLCFGLLEADRQIGFARVVTDCATFAYLADVFVLAERRGLGLGKWLIECVMSHPELQGLRRWVLGTRDAHGLYRPFGFTSLKRPEIFMERHDPDVYRRGAREDR
jgi:GNAT superfamily N-acetyltransferase